MNKLQSLRNSLKVFLSGRNFLTRSKKVICSAIPPTSLEGGIGEGKLGTRVGETGGTSGTAGLACSTLARCERSSAMHSWSWRD